MQLVIFSYKYRVLQSVHAEDLEALLLLQAQANPPLLLLPLLPLPLPRPPPPRQPQALLSARPPPPLQLAHRQLPPAVAANAAVWLLGIAALPMLAVAKSPTTDLCGKPSGGLKLRLHLLQAVFGSPRVLALPPSVNVSSMLAANFNHSAVGYAVS